MTRSSGAFGSSRPASAPSTPSAAVLLAFAEVAGRISESPDLGEEVREDAEWLQALGRRLALEVGLPSYPLTHKEFRKEAWLRVRRVCVAIDEAEEVLEGAALHTWLKGTVGRKTLTTGPSPSEGRGEARRGGLDLSALDGEEQGGLF